MVTPEVVRKVKGRDLTFFEHNIRSMLNLDEGQNYTEYVDKYSTYITGLIRENVTDKTREGLWTLVDDIIATV
jgi:hypothetical protein